MPETQDNDTDRLGLPWIAAGGTITDGNGVNAALFLSGAATDRRQDAHERAAYAVRAANAYPSLVEAIRQAYAALEQGQTGEAADWLREAMQRHSITPVEQQQEAR